jgi:AcrR family transcriptional regulator
LSDAYNRIIAGKRLEPIPLQGKAEQLIHVAFGLACREGFEAITIRAVATQAGVSLQTVHKYLGPMSEVRVAVVAHLISHLTDWHAARKLAPSAGLAPVTAEGMVLSTLNELAGIHRGAALLWEEALNTGKYPQLVAAERGFVAHWHERLLRVGCGPEEAIVWCDFMCGLMPLILLDGVSESIQSWFPLLIRRLSDRLWRWPSFPEEVFPFHPLEVDFAPPVSEAAYKILDAAIHILAEQGGGEFTHRAVAARAGVSSATPAYFFSSRAHLIIATIHEIFRRTSIRVRQQDGTESGLAYNVLDGDGRIREELRAIHKVFNVVARDPQLAPGIMALRDFRGPVAREALRHYGIAVDTVDSFIASTAFEGVLRQSRLPAGDLTDFVEARLALHRNVLFSHLKT